MGTELLCANPDADARYLARWVREHPNKVRAVHRASADAGAQLLTTNTLLAWREPDSEDLITRAVSLCREVAPHLPVAVSLGPGARAGVYRHLARVAQRAGADLLQLETFTSTHDLTGAVAETVGTLPVVALLVPNAQEKTLGCGTALDDAADSLVQSGASAVGLNCVSPEIMRSAVAALREGAGGIPLVLRPSANENFNPAGNKRVDGETSRYDSPVSWADAVYSLIDCASHGCAGHTSDTPSCVVGGCCGAGPGFIRALAARLEAEPLELCHPVSISR